MGQTVAGKQQDRLVSDLSRLWMDPQDALLVEKTLHTLNSRYGLNRKLAREPGVGDILQQMVGRLAKSYPRLTEIKDSKILDIACGSNTSKLPASLYVNTPFGEISFGRAKPGFTALFEPWFCRILFELGANPVGIDFGDLEGEIFQHYRLDLGKAGSLDFLPAHSFDGIQDSRLFGSPEFTTQFPNQADRVKIAREIHRQEERLLKPDGILIHSDASALL